MTSPRGTPLPLRVLRPGATVARDRTFETTLLLRASPLAVPELPGPPLVGDAAPVLPASLEPVGRARLPNYRGHPRLLFFWATWCEPCKLAVPEVLALARTKGFAVLAISDEDADTVAGFLKTREEPFFEQVAVDAYRRSFVSHGVSGTPTILIVNDEGVVVHRQIGYNPAVGLTVEGWSWSRP